MFLLTLRQHVILLALTIMSHSFASEIKEGFQNSEHNDANTKGWEQLFNGKDLKGWTPVGGTAPFVVKDGTIMGTTKLNTPNSFLMPDRLVSDFELRFEVKCDSGLNSGVQIRSAHKEEQLPTSLNKDEKRKAMKRITGKSLVGPQVEIAANGNVGAVWFEAVSGWLLSPNPKLGKKVYKPEEWNLFRILAQGKNIKVWINNTLISDANDNRSNFKEGHLGFQVHSIRKNVTDMMSVQWRNIEIRDL